ncbi:hypothetical protein ACIBF5_03510 [Micromonospora sp. NPDC050417]|uniref:hypothetical protein n=1 Tax=Micromonospora sp. NPDC050417 TaxID=3364280 RepID=UPI0037B2A4CB
MTAGQSSRVDLDLLADYLGGVLTDTPEEAAVTRLISTDPEWASAHAELSRAFDSVGASLDVLAAAPEPMPAQITDRLTAALANAAPIEPATIPSQPTEVTERRLSLVPDPEDRVPGDRDRPVRASRRRWSRLAGPVAVAAAVAAFAGFGLSRLGMSAEDGGATSNTVDAPPAVSELPLNELAPERAFASGTNYTSTGLSSTLAALGRHSGEERGGADTAAPPSGSPGTMAAPSTQEDRVRIPAALARLGDPTALTACLDAIALTHGLGPVTFKLVDFATFEGNPALVVAFTDQTGARWGWVSGVACGQPGSGPDTRYHARVG